VTKNILHQSKRSQLDW